MDMMALINQLGTMFIFIVIGIIANKSGVINESGHKMLSKIVLTICQPALILAAAMNSNLSYTNLEILKFFGLSWIFYGVLIALAFILTPLLRAPKNKIGLYRFMVIFGNVAFMGYPIIGSMLSNEWVFVASIFTIPYNSLAYSVGILMVGSGNEKGIRVNPKAILNPALVATVLSLIIVLLRLKFPTVIFSSAKSLGDMITPASMLVIGASLGGMKLRDLFGDARIYVISFFKLIVAPVVIWMLARLVISDKELIAMLTITAAMPVAVASTMISIQYGGDEQSASRGVFLSTILSLLTLPLITYFLLI